MNDLGRLYVVETASNFLYRGDEGFWSNDFGIEDDQCCVHLLVGIELDVGSGYAWQVVKFFSDFGDAGDFTHHSRDGKLGYCFLCCTGAVDVLHLDVTLRAA